jgi:hypothetical protein
MPHCSRISRSGWSAAHPAALNQGRLDSCGRKRRKVKAAEYAALQTLREIRYPHFLQAGLLAKNLSGFGKGSAQSL